MLRTVYNYKLQRSHTAQMQLSFSFPESYSTFVKNFGEKLLDVEYIVRPSAWVIVLDDSKRILAVEHQGQYFLPGGGIEQGETALEALDRELAEEIGWRAKIGAEICGAGQYLYAEFDQAYFYKEGIFFSAELTQQISLPEECEHRYSWLTIDEFREFAAHESHIYAVEQWI